MTAEWFDAAVETDNEGYLEAEGQLIGLARSDATERAALADRLDAADPVTRLVATVLLHEAEADEPQVARVDDYLNRAERYFAARITRVPPIDGVVDTLTAQFGTGLGELLALRLLKVASPPWRMQVALDYLTQNPTPAATEALLRFASTTTEPQFQAAAARAVLAARDRDLERKLAAERQRLAAAGQSLPPALTSLLA